jgi:predicted RNase H-like nuclease
MTETVLGIDACKTGWIGVVLRDGNVSARYAPNISSLVGQVQDDGDVAVVGIDMPIGLADSGFRRADALARKEVGRRRSSVFSTPVRDALLAPSHAAAVRKSQELTGQAITIQAYSLKTKLLEVDEWVRNTALRPRVVEIHPEVSFAELAGAPLLDSKTTWAGVEHRRQLLAAAGISLGADLGEAGRLVRVDDVLDAGVVAWSARRVAMGQARSLPHPPERFSDGLECAIWV